MNCPPSSDRWYYAHDRKKLGPVSLADLHRLVAGGVIKPTDMVFQEGTQKWLPLADAINNGREPQSMNSPPLADLWYYVQNKRKVGPVGPAQLCQLLAEGVLTPADMVFQEGTTAWRPLGEVAEASPGAARTVVLSKGVLAGCCGLLFLAFVGWGLVAVLLGLPRYEYGENPETEARAFVDRGQTTTPSVGAGEKPSAKGDQESPGPSGATGDAQQIRRSADPLPAVRERPRLLVQLGHQSYVTSVAFSPDGKQVLTGSPDHTARLWDVPSGKELRAFLGHATEVSSVAFSPDGKQVLTGSPDRTARLWDAQSGRPLRAFVGHAESYIFVAFSPDGKQVLAGTPEGPVRLWDAQSGKHLGSFTGHVSQIRSVTFSADGKQVLTNSADGTVRLWETQTCRELCRFISFTDGASATFTPDNYYQSSTRAMKGVAFQVGDRIFSFDQFDLRFNRPDKVLESIGIASSEMVAAYRQAYQKRLKRMNFSEEMLGDDFHIPEVSVTSGVNAATSEKTLRLNVKASDSAFLLDRLYVHVNGVPLHGTGGLGLRERRLQTWEQEIEVELSRGRNKIDVSVLNEKDAESLKESVVIDCEAPARKPNLYVVAVGISDYQDTRFRLTYADKDARDLADLFENRRGRYGEVKALRLLNRDATRENVLKVKDFLKTSRVEDSVVLFFAGHGLLDGKLDYYFATADIDFADPAKRGLAYEAIEDLLDGIPARKKLLLMDTCHSGELDKDDVQLVQLDKQPEGEVKTRTFRSGLSRVKPRVGLGNSYQLLQEMFADLRRGTGAAVIASAGGAEYALESASWKNGVFTHALLRGLRGEADRNRDGAVQVSELRDFVEQEVQRLTGGQQTPTSRRENLEVDFAVE